MGYVQLLNLAETYILTDDYLARNDTQRTTTSTTYVKLKETRIIFEVWPTSSLRIKFTLRCNDGHWVYGRIYYNGQPIGTERSTDLVAPTEFSEDFTFNDLKSNDTLEVWGRSLAGTTTTYVTNFRIFGQGTKFLAVT